MGATPGQRQRRVRASLIPRSLRGEVLGDEARPEVHYFF